MFMLTKPSLYWAPQVTSRGQALLLKAVEAFLVELDNYQVRGYSILPIKKTVLPFSLHHRLPKYRIMEMDRFCIYGGQEF
ncbi:hypothetical protein ABE66_09830 [Cytobacillus firmus]|nr:hypothetical protein [Cytobacillus firmus]